jgi:hypothetical protein
MRRPRWLNRTVLGIGFAKCAIILVCRRHSGGIWIQRRAFHRWRWADSPRDGPCHSSLIQRSTFVLRHFLEELLDFVRNDKNCDRRA